MCALGVLLGRLGQEAKALMVPTVEDVFHADTNSTEDYLGEIQSMTILTAIQVQGQLCQAHPEAKAACVPQHYQHTAVGHVLAMSIFLQPCLH